MSLIEIKDLQERFFAEFPYNQFESIRHAKAGDTLPVLTNQFSKLIQAYKWGFIPEKPTSAGEGRIYGLGRQSGRKDVLSLFLPFQYLRIRRNIFCTK